MAGKVLEIEKLLVPDQLGMRIARYWQTWNTLRQEKVNSWDEIRRYVYATDTTNTSNSNLPWKNKTTLPKLCQIRDNLFANYMAALFPKRDWLEWEGGDKGSETKSKKDAIKNYMMYCVEHSKFKDTIASLLLDYFDYGNCFSCIEWVDARIEQPDKVTAGYVGPKARRISPLDVVFNPIAPTFIESPKIVRSLVSLGEIKGMLEQMSTEENKEELQEFFKYLTEVRHHASSFAGELSEKDAYLKVDGFVSFQSYLESDYAEVLTFYGDAYDADSDTYLRNCVVKVIDRHKVLHKEPHPSFFGHAPIYHSGWRRRQDNLWAMGPLDNLVGMQYRIDHLENLKADVFDLIAFPPLKIKGYVDDFTWGPMAKIYVGDDGDVEMVAPDVQALNANIEIDLLMQRMEEMAGAPKEAMGFRTPGEKTAYEVQRLENAAARIFHNKIAQFEEQVIEPLLSSMLELARRKMDSTTIRVMDDEMKIAEFQKLTPEDIAGNGRIRPVAARNFAEKAERIQNLNNFFTSVPGQDQLVLAHFSSIKVAEMFEDLLDLDQYKLVQAFIRITEQADAQKLAMNHQEQAMMEAQTPTGLTPDDSTEPFSEQP